jgi:hypothetical protein
MIFLYLCILCPRGKPRDGPGIIMPRAKAHDYYAVSPSHFFRPFIWRKVSAAVAWALAVWGGGGGGPTLESAMPDYIFREEGKR